MDDPLEKLFVAFDRGFEAKKENLKAKGWQVRWMGGDFIIRCPNDLPNGKPRWLGSSIRYISLFETEYIAWQYLIESRIF